MSIPIEDVNNYYRECQNLNDDEEIIVYPPRLGYGSGNGPEYVIVKRECEIETDTSAIGEGLEI